MRRDVVWFVVAFVLVSYIMMYSDSLRYALRTGKDRVWVVARADTPVALLEGISYARDDRLLDVTRFVDGATAVHSLKSVFMPDRIVWFDPVTADGPLMSAFTAVGLKVVVVPRQPSNAAYVSKGYWSVMPDILVVS